MLRYVTSDMGLYCLHMSHKKDATVLSVNRMVGHLNSLFVCLFALRPKSTAMVIAGRSVHLYTLFPGQA